MNQNILIVIPCCKNDAARAEQLIDSIFQLEGRQAKGHCLLVCAQDVHTEMRAKLKISASLAFETVELFDQLEIITMTKHEQCMEMLRQTAQHIANTYRWPWLWLEPDCLPLVSGWLDKLAAAYASQPRRYLGLRVESAGVTFLWRTCVYPHDAINDLNMAMQLGIPIDQHVVNKSINCRLFQFLAINSTEDASKVRADALILHHDKRGLLLDWVAERAINESRASMGVGPFEKVEPYLVDSNGHGKGALLTAPKRRGRPPKSVSQLTEPITV